MQVKSRVTQSKNIEGSKTARVTSSDSDLVREEIEYRASDHDAVVMVAMILYHRPLKGTDKKRATVREASLSRRHGLTKRSTMNPVDLNLMYRSSKGPEPFALRKSGPESQRRVSWVRPQREQLCLLWLAGRFRAEIA